MATFRSPPMTPRPGELVSFPHLTPSMLAMPEAAMHEDRRAVFWEHQVRSPGEVADVKAIPQPKRMQHAAVASRASYRFRESGTCARSALMESRSQSCATATAASGAPGAGEQHFEPRQLVLKAEALDRGEHGAAANAADSLGQK